MYALINWVIPATNLIADDKKREWFNNFSGRLCVNSQFCSLTICLDISLNRTCRRKYVRTRNYFYIKYTRCESFGLTKKKIILAKTHFNVRSDRTVVYIIVCYFFFFIYTFTCGCLLFRLTELPAHSAQNVCARNSSVCLFGLHVIHTDTHCEWISVHCWKWCANNGITITIIIIIIIIKSHYIEKLYTI